MAEAPCTTIGRSKILDHLEGDLHDRHDDELRNALPRLDGESRAPRFQQETMSGP